MYQNTFDNIFIVNRSKFFYLNLLNYHNFESSNALTVVVLAALLNKAKSPNPSVFLIFLANYNKNNINNLNIRFHLSEFLGIHLSK
jgi:hypothetical protein